MPTPAALAGRRLLGNRSVVAGALILLVFVLAAIFAGVLSTHNPTRLAPASAAEAAERATLSSAPTSSAATSTASCSTAAASRCSSAVTTMLLTSIGGIVIGLVAGYSRRLDRS